MKMRLLLLPGMDGTGLLFRRFIDTLPDSVSPEVVSYPVDKEMSYADLAGTVRERLSADQPAVVVAESFSGPVGIQLAAGQAPGLKGLVMVSTFAKAPRSRLWSLIARPGMFLLRPPAFLLRRYLTGPDARDALVEEVADAISRVEPRVMSSRIRLVLAVDLRRETGRIRVPMMGLAGRLDRLLVRTDALRRLRPDMRWHQMEAPHLVLQRVPEEAAGHITRFIASLQTGSTPPRENFRTDGPYIE